MKHPIKVAQLGLGPIGLATLRAAAAKPWIKVLGGIDADPSKAGQDLGELCGQSRLRSLSAHAALDELLESETPDLVFHTTISSFRAAYGQLEFLACRGISVVSSCEELAFPQLREPALAAKLDRLCARSGARIVAAGVNPGFVMDVLPLCLSGVVSGVRAIQVQRVVDASTRRAPLQRKIGSGLPPAQFRRLFKQGQLGHRGLKESLCLLAHGLGFKVRKLSETCEPVIADRKICTRYLEVNKGETRGLHQRVEAIAGGQVRLTLDLRMCLRAERPHDAIQIEGDPVVNLRIEGGVAGDQATVAALINTAPRLLQARPGLRLLTELPLAVDR